MVVRKQSKICCSRWGSWIEMSPENANNLLQALDQFGFGSLGLQAEKVCLTIEYIFPYLNHCKAFGFRTGN